MDYWSMRVSSAHSLDSLESDSEETELVQEADDCLLPEEDL